MEKISLNTSFKDSCMDIYKQGLIPTLVASLVVLYLEDITFMELFTILLVLSLSIILFMFALSKVDGISLTPEGISYQDWRGENMILSWDADIEAKLLKSRYRGFVQITSKELKNNIHISGKKLREDKVSNYINKYSPKSHKLREFIKDIN